MEKTPDGVTILKSVYKMRPPTIYFPYPEFVNEKRSTARTVILNKEDEK